VRRGHCARGQDALCERVGGIAREGNKHCGGSNVCGRGGITAVSASSNAFESHRHRVWLCVDRDCSIVASTSRCLLVRNQSNEKVFDRSFRISLLLDLDAAAENHGSFGALWSLQETKISGVRLAITDQRCETGYYKTAVRD
jgi:hypothetical protein